MIKIAEAENRIERETPAVRGDRPLCVALLNSGIKIWQKGRREFFVLPYELVYREAQRCDARVSIPARKVSDAKLEKAKEAIDEHGPRKLRCDCAADVGTPHGPECPQR